MLKTIQYQNIKQMPKLLTIVVPVYKVEPYINKCLDSCLVYKSNGQGEKVLDDDLMNHLEVIIVNDGTPDNSAELSREYVKRYPNTFRQIDKENGGHGSAWNVGLKEATGKYLRFLDSDDWLTNLDRLMLDLQNCEADVVFNQFAKQYVEDGSVETIEIALPQTDNKYRPIDVNKWGECKDGLNSFNFWSITYKTEILEPLQPLFAEKVMYDDFIITWVPLVHGRTYTTCDYVLYNYLIGRPDQSMSVAKQEKRARSYWSCFQKYEEVRSRIDEMSTPTENLTVIDQHIQAHAAFIIWYLAFLPYKESKKRLAYLYKNYLHGLDYSAVMKRYSKLPFFLFYWIEHLRYIKNNR